MKKFLLFCAAQAFVMSIIAQPEIISYGSIWKYLDNGSNQGVGWTAISFNDALWKSGPAELGYGDGDEATVISYGGRPKKKYITSFFRKEFSVADPSQYASLELKIKRDDGAVVYLNGVEVFRTNMPSGKITYATTASSKISDALSHDQTTLTPARLVSGKNVIAVEIHQFRNGDSDVSFDLQLTGLLNKKNTPPVANAGPDQNIKLPVNSVKLNGAGSYDKDGTITHFSWSKISGPSTYSITNPEKKETVVKGLVEGAYLFRLTVTDNAGVSSNDAVVINVTAANLPPIPDAGPDQTIFMPGNAVMLDGTNSKDPDGKIKAFEWKQISGPATALLLSPTKSKSSVVGLSVGVYKFQLTVKDNGGKTAWDDVVITVKASTSSPSSNFISFGDSWKYLDDGSDGGTEWRQPGFDDDSWASGNGELGYGDGDESTVVSYGPDKHNKYITTYFRKLVNIPNPASYSEFTLAVKRDDGVVVYLNGNEVFRNNMPDGDIDYLTLASSGAFRDGYDIQSLVIPAGSFIDGANTIAVEIHQIKVTSSDISFDLSLAGNGTGENLPPVANAGPDQTITLPTNSVTLEGNASSDADGAITTWLWTKVSGPSTYTITSPGNANTTVTGLVQGTYTFRLTVTDNDGASDNDDVVITVNAANLPPVANAGPDQTITLPTNSVTLNGNGSSDADGSITTWLWTKISGPSTYTITSPGNASTTVTGLVQGTYTFCLAVKDDDGASDNDDVVITVNAANLPPVANAGPDQIITLPTNSVTLNGNGSSDADGSITTWLWTKISGPSTYTITSPGNASTTVTGLVRGTYTFRLAVTDDDGASDNDDVVISVNPANLPPVANAGPDQTITLPTNSVTLNGNGSSDADGSITSWLWTKISGPSTYTITNPGNASTTVTGLVQGTYTFRLAVTDDDGASDNDDVVITVNAANLPPVANAGPDQTITLPTNSVTLNGNGSSDADGSITSWLWTKISGPSTYTITNPGNASTTVTGLVQGTYTFRLAVTDDDGASDNDDVVITVNAANLPPVANAGPDQTITLPTNSVTLNGNGSSDADGSITTWLWTKISGPSTYTITSPGNASTTVTGLVQGTYTFRLAVTDDDGVSDNDDVVITVNPANLPPVANAGPDQTITLPTNSVTLNGNGSSDADGSITTWLWTKISGPSTYTITSPGNASTTVTGLVQGTYTFRLAVKDDDGASDNDDVVITVNAANLPPVANAGPDQIITLPTNSVTLNGNGSSDADGSITTWLWTKISGPSTYTITSPGNASTTVTGLVQGTYTFRLAVTDDDGASDNDDVVISVNPANLPPVANAGPDQTITLPTNSVTLNGNGSSDADGSITSWLWTKISGPSTYTITNPGNASTTVTGLVQGTYTFRLAVTDDDGASDNDDVVITVNAANLPPVANAGPDQTITLPTNSVTLNGNGSSDADGSITTWLWTKISGPSTYTITNPGNASTTVTGLVQGTYTFRLAVTDDDGASDNDDVVITVNATAGGPITLTRGPYLQMASTTAVTLRWRTDVASDSKISVGTQNGVYTASATNASVTTEHEVRINNLSAGKKYYYSFGSSSQTLQAGSDNFFNTAPSTSSTGKIRVAAFGDCGRNQNGFQTGALNAYRNYVGNSPAEIMLLLGDNAYTDGTDAEYQSNFFDVYSSSLLKNHVLFPAPGNHDYHTTTQAERTAPYYNVFTMPTAAECGGVASGTKAFYSFNWGNIHFLSLDSYGQEAGSTRLYDTLGPQVTWIKQDLAANSSKWTIAFWHHPPHTKGSHNSDSESELVKIRQNFIRILERFGVDMVMCGHSHDYERSYLLKDYYGNEASFDLATNTASSSSAYYDGSGNSCPYNLPSGKVNHGTVYIVSGSAGADGSVQSGYPHDAMPFSVDDGGMFYFEVEDNRLDAKFLRRDGTIADKFTILKDAGKTTAVSIATGQSVTLTASWIGKYSWSNGANTQSITVTPSSSTTYTCSDGSGCITDKFNVSVGSPANSITLATAKFDYKLTAYPTPVIKGEWLTITTNVAVPLEVNVLNDKGQKVKNFKLLGSTRMNTSDMRNGVYYLRSEKDGKKMVRKIMIIH